MPFKSGVVRKKPVNVWAAIQPIVDPSTVAILFNNSSSRPAKFYVSGVSPDNMVIELDGNTSWHTTMPLGKKADQVSISIGEPDGEIIAQGSVFPFE